MRLNSVGERELVEMRWGFAGKDDTNPSRPKHMHARGESVDRLRTFAVICEEWHNCPETLQTFVQVTVPANALISRITDRMPAILPRETWPMWLGETGDSLDEVKALLQTFEDGGNWAMTAQAPSKPPRPPKPPKQKAQQDLF